MTPKFNHPIKVGFRLGIYFGINNMEIEPVFFTHPVFTTHKC